MAAAFTNVVTSFVSDILLPPLSVLLPLNANLDFKFAVLQAGATYSDLPHGYRTIEQAQADGAVIMAYGVFLNKTLNFIGLGSALYALAGLYQYLSKDPIIKHMVKCRYCRKRINEKVSGICCCVLYSLLLAALGVGRWEYASALINCRLLCAHSPAHLRESLL